jgi:hypothetical protein
MSSTFTKVASKTIIESFKSQPKERLDMILEPLQVMIQLAILGFCPVGSKMAIHENIILVQRPNWVQPVYRWYGRDSKEDLYYLFHAIRRYYLWYKSQEEEPIFDYILEKAKIGITKLIETYNQAERTSLIHTLSLYKNILELESPDLFKSEDDSAVNIDTVFKTITKIYDKKLLMVVFSTLKLIDEEIDETNKSTYFDGLQNILIPTHIKIRSWIRRKLSC